MPLPSFRASADERALAGVCAGIAQTLGVDVTLVRLLFALLALAGGAGIVLYLALWAWDRRRVPWIPALLGLVGVSLVLHALGFGDRVVAGIGLVAAGLVLVSRHGARLSSSAPLSVAGVALTAGGAVLVLSRGGVHASLLAPGAIAGSLLLIGGPWLWRLALDRDLERSARIRSEERAEMAARVHDSVLQTLALIQRHADDPRRVAAYARRQERELRDWLYADRPAGQISLVAMLAAAAADLEEQHGVRVELASSGDCPGDDRVRALVLAAREAMRNAAKHSGAEVVDVYAEVDQTRSAVFVRDRGAGFAPGSAPVDRRGISDSIVARMRRAGGTATVTSAPGEGTEVELSLPRGPS
jgi:signal transduction histidine kinase